jgi:hypothetical protein
MLVCVLGICGILLRGLALHYAHVCATTGAHAVTLKDDARLEARQAAISAARVSDMLSSSSLVVMVFAAAVYFAAHRRRQAKPFVPVLLLVIYTALFLLQV